MIARRGFTFVELLVAFVVFGALSAIAVPRYREYKARAYVAAMKSDLGNLRIAEEVHWAEHQQYATDTASLDLRVTTDVRLRITSQDLLGGYTAVASHRLVPGQECATAMGREAAPREPGMIQCGPVTGGSATIPGAP